MGFRYAAVLLGVIIVAVIVGIVAGQSRPQTVAAPAPTPTPTPLPAPIPNHVYIEASPSPHITGVYVPGVVTVRVGQTITWTNLDNNAHTVTAENGAFDSGVLNPGQSFKWKATKPGRYPYGSFLQPDEHGIIIVRS